MPEKQKSALDPTDIMTLGGLACLGVGLWFVDWRLSLSVVGLLAFGLGASAAWQRGR